MSDETGSDWFRHSSTGWGLLRICLRAFSFLSSSGQRGNYLNVDEFPVVPLVRQNLMNFIYYKLPNSKIHFLTIYDIIRCYKVSIHFMDVPMARSHLARSWNRGATLKHVETPRRPQRSSGGQCLLGIDKISSSWDSFIILPKMYV